MQKRGFFGYGKVTAMLSLVLLVLAQQVYTSPVLQQDQVQSGSDQSSSPQVDQRVPALRRIARMTPLWRVLSSKPYGAHCRSNYECSTGFCWGGRCSFSHRSSSEPVKY